MTEIRPVAPLFVPATRPERFAKAAASGADAIIIDLEDSVAPHEKDAARLSARDHGVTEVPVLIRINGGSTPWHEADLDCLRDAELAGLVLPKAEIAGVLGRLHSRLSRDVRVYPLIESARGMESLGDILSEPCVAGAIFGSLDYSLDMGCTSEWEPLLPARMALVQKSRSLGLPPPIEGVTPDIGDAEKVAAEAGRARDCGFGGKLAIHPSQVKPILDAFRPTPEQTDWARRVIDAVDQGADGAFQIDGRMIDAPVIEAARAILAKARRMGDGG